MLFVNQVSFVVGLTFFSFFQTLHVMHRLKIRLRN